MGLTPNTSPIFPPPFSAWLLLYQPTPDALELEHFTLTLQEGPVIIRVLPMFSSPNSARLFISTKRVSDLKCSTLYVELMSLTEIAESVRTLAALRRIDGVLLDPGTPDARAVEPDEVIREALKSA
jgi:hypothetical protein